MKIFTRLLLIPVVLAQLSFSPKAEAKLNWWEAAGIGVLAGVLTYEVLSHNDEDQMNTAMRGSFRASLRVGDRVPWQGDRHSGHYVFDAEGTSVDGQYSNCRRVRPVAYNQSSQEVDMRTYRPTCACQTADNRWRVIPEDQFVVRQPQQEPYYTANNDYQNSSPYAPFYGRNCMMNSTVNPCYQQRPAPIMTRPVQYTNPDVQYQNYDTNVWTNNSLDANLGLHINF